MIIDIVLFFCEGRGGVEDVTTTISNILISKGHRVRIFQAYKPVYPEWEERINEFYLFGIGLPWNSYIGDYANNYRKIIDKIGKPDVVLATQQLLCNKLCYMALNKNNEEHPPIISWCHLPLDQLGSRELLCYSDYHLAISKDVKTDLEKSISSNVIELVGNPIEMNNCGICKRPTGKLKLLYIGRLANSHKRIDILFMALTKVKGDWSLKIIGSGTDYPMLLSLSKELGIDKNIEWVGWMNNPWAQVTEASLLILPSDYEGFGLVTVQALARGIPVVATKTAGATEIISNNKNGWLFDIGSSPQLADILNKIQDGSLSLPNAKSCIDSVKRFDETIVTDKIEEILIKQYNKKLIDLVVLDENSNYEPALLKIFKKLKEQGHRIRLFEPFAPKCQQSKDIVSERYYYGLNLGKNPSLHDYSIYYKKLIKQVGNPDIIFTAYSSSVNPLYNETLKNISRKIPVISLPDLGIDINHASLDHNSQHDITPIINIINKLFGNEYEEKEIE